MLPVGIYPYMNLEDLNLDYILKKLMKLETDVQDFVEMNAIKYADPIQWSITTQYEKNTIVIDPATGSAYLSVRPVPAGIDISRTEYWTEVFNLSALIQDAVRNLTEHDAGISTVATFSSDPGEWVMWKDILYVATSQITPGDAYTVGGNIARLTVEAAIKSVAALIGQNAQAIAAEAETRAQETGLLNESINQITQNVGNLNDLTTADKNNLVAAINEVAARPIPVGGEEFWHNVKEEFGAIGDAVTDDTEAIKAAVTYMQENRVGLYFPEGQYKITETITLDSTLPPWFVVRGAHKTKTVLRADLTSGYLFDLQTEQNFRNAAISDMTLINVNVDTNINGINIYRMSHSAIHDIIFRGFVISINASMSWCMLLYNCNFSDRSNAGAQAQLQLAYQCNVWFIYSCQFANRTDFTSAAVSVSRAQTNIYFLQCSIQYGMGVTMSGVASDGAPLSNVTFDSCYFEWMQTVCIRSNVAAAGIIKNVTIRNCYFNAIENGNVAYAIDPRYIDGITINDNFAVRFTTQMISLDGEGTPAGAYEIRGNTTDGIPVVRVPCHEIKGSGTAAPTLGYHHAGEIVFANVPTASVIGWICTASGTPGTWTPINPT